MMSYAFPSRRAVLAVAPETEPVSLSTAKTYLRIDGTDEDALISSMIAAARLVAEEQTGLAFISQRWRVHFDEVAPLVVVLPRTPVQAITAVTSVAENGDVTVISAGQYHLNARQDLVFESTVYGHQVTIEFSCGYGDTSDDVPADIVQAILLHVAYLYEHRDSMMPPKASALSYAKYREVRL